MGGVWRNGAIWMKEEIVWLNSQVDFYFSNIV